MTSPWSRRMFAAQRSATGWLPFALAAYGVFHAGCSPFDRSSGTIVVPGLGVSVSKSRYLQNKGVKHYQVGELDAAAQALEKSVLVDPRNAAAHNNLGLVRLDQRLLFDAATHLEIASRLRPSDPTPLNNLGMVMEAGGKGYEALEYYEQAAELAPINPVYLGNALRTRIRLGERDESIIARLQELRFIEQRPEWIAWIDRQLALEINPLLDRGPAAQLTAANPADAAGRGRDTRGPADGSGQEIGEPIDLGDRSTPPDGPEILLTPAGELLPESF